MKTIFQHIMVAVVMLTSMAANADDKGHLFIIGGATAYEWNLDKAQALLSTPEYPNVYTGTLYLKGGEGNTFKFMEASEWGSTEYGLPSDSESTLVSGDVQLASGTLDDGYKQMYVENSGNYNISVDVASKTAQIVYAEYQATEIQYTSLFAVGGATPGSWSVDDGTPLYQSISAPYEYSANIKLNAAPESFKIATSLRGGCSFDAMYYYFRDDDDATKISTDNTDDRQWSVTEDGIYEVKVNTVSNTISIEKAPTTGIEPIVASPANVGEISYFNLQGQRVNNPSNGLFIEVSGNDVRKVILH